MKYDTQNEMFTIAVDLVTRSDRNIFLTGKAGTGKTTFLKYIRENCRKQMAIVAPTGVAAINAGGVTIHSFFQLPLSPFVPSSAGTLFGDHHQGTSTHDLISRLRFNSDKLKLLRELELLIIDEISMVRCDTIDAIDVILRHVRRQPERKFGGIQVVFIGDMFQLPPVVKDPEWQILSGTYNSPFFFDSLVIREEPPLYIEFSKIYRQSEETFIRLLNQVRNNALEEDGREILEARFKPTFRRTKDDGYIILTTHNGIARETNTSELQKLAGPVYTYSADIEDDFPENAFPAEAELRLRAGAQVMFIKNDPDKARRYFNGKIGIVTRLDQLKVFVRCDDGEELEVKKEKWENIRYSLDKTSRKVSSDLLGSFAQFPLRLAWAITIHKSQGLTFEKAIIDAGEAFAPGQVYVALSRCTSLNGVILKSRIRQGSLLTDPRISDFAARSASTTRLRDELKTAHANYLFQLLRQTFDLEHAHIELRQLIQYVEQHKTSFNAPSFGWLDAMDQQITALQQVSIKFQQWMAHQFSQPLSPFENSGLQERIKAGANHFREQLQHINGNLLTSPATTDNRTHAKEYNDALREIFISIALKLDLFRKEETLMNVDAWQLAKQNFIIPVFQSNAYAGESYTKNQSAHPALHTQLRKLRDSIASKKDLPIYMVAATRTIDELVQFLPATMDDLQSISGFGKARINSFGEQFLSVIREYCDRNRIEQERMTTPSPVKTKKAGKEKQSSDGKLSSRTITYNLFRDGNDIPQIASARSLSISTIESHLLHFITSGELDVSEILSPNKVKAIVDAAGSNSESSMTALKETLDPGISFSDIRFVLSWMKAKQSSLPGDRD